MRRHVSAALLVLLVPLAARAQDWNVIESDNFRIYYVQPKEYAVKVAALAEKKRTEVAKKWFGDVNDWDRPCTLYLHPDEKSLSGYSGGVAGPGFTQINRGSGGIETRAIHLRVDFDKVWGCVLPHEITHALIADKLGWPGYIPRWIDEGMACQAEMKANYALHKANLVRNKENLFKVETLMNMKDYPKRLDVFYAESACLVHYLVDLKGEARFVAFVRAAGKDGYESALKDHYGTTYLELQRAWLKAMME